MKRPHHLIILTAVLTFSTLCRSANAGQQPTLPPIDPSTIATSQTIEGVPCGAGRIWKFKDTGVLHRCTLDRDAVVRGVAFPKGTSVTFNADRSHRIVFLPQTTMIDGHACKGSADNFMTGLYADGKLQLCWLPEDAVIDGVPCAAFSFWSDVVMRNASGVYFHQNGKLMSCRLSKPFKQDGRTLAKGERIHLPATVPRLPSTVDR